MRAPHRIRGSVAIAATATALGVGLGVVPGVAHAEREAVTDRGGGVSGADITRLVVDHQRTQVRLVVHGDFGPTDFSLHLDRPGGRRWEHEVHLLGYGGDTTAHLYRRAQDQPRCAIRTVSRDTDGDSNTNVVTFVVPRWCADAPTSLRATADASNRSGYDEVGWTPWADRG